MLDYIGENIIKLDIEEIKRLHMKYVDFEDKIGNVSWAVVENNGLYFVYKRINEDEPHEFEGIACTDDFYEVIGDIKEFYEFDKTPEEIEELIREDEIELELLKEVVNFLDRIFLKNSYSFDFDEWIYKVKNVISKFNDK